MSNNSGVPENISRLSFPRNDEFPSSLNNSTKSGFQKAASLKSVAMERNGNLREAQAALLDSNPNNDGASKSSQSSEHSHNNQNSNFVPIRRYAWNFTRNISSVGVVSLYYPGRTFLGKRRYFSGIVA